MNSVWWRVLVFVVGLALLGLAQWLWGVVWGPEAWRP